MLRRYRTSFPWRRLSLTAVVDQHQPLALIVLERQRQPSVDFDDLAGDDARLFQAVAPISQALFTGNAQAGARNRVGPAALGSCGKIEEGEIGAGIGFAVGVEQMIGADIVL